MAKDAAGRARLEKLSKARLIQLIMEEREAARLRLAEKEKTIAELTEQLASVQREHDEESHGRKIRDINPQVNEPSSKKPEWDKDGNPKPPKKRRKKKKKRKKDPGCGNGRKSLWYRMRPTTSPLMPAPVAGLTCMTGKARSAPGVG